MHSITKRFARVIVGVALAGLFVCPGTASAERGWYGGVDLVQLQTTLDYGTTGPVRPTETYTTSHLRVRGGYQILDFLSVEGRVITSGHDTDIGYLGNQFRFDTGSMVGLYARPHTNFRVANVYGIVGLTVMNSHYEFLALGLQDNDMLFLETVGVGGDFRVTNDLFISIEAQYYLGTAHYWNNGADVSGFGVGAGLRYRF